MGEAVLVVRARAREGREAELEEMLTKAMADANENDPGVIEFTLHRGLEDSRMFVLYERFVSRKGLDERRQRQSSIGMRSKIEELLELNEETLVEPLP